jgi:hypothetical protein
MKYLQNLDKRDKNIYIALIIALFGIIFFIALALTLPFQGK